MTDTKADPTVTDPGTGPADDADTGTDDKGTGTDAGKDTDSGDEDDPDEEDAPSADAYKKLEAKAKRREDALRKAQAELKELKAKDSDTPEVSAEDRANQKLVRASAKTALTAAGITDREDQAAVLGMINLADIEVDDNGDPDEDEISDRVEKLRKIFGGKAPQRQTPRRETSDRGGSGSATADPTSKRMQAFLRR